jgi:hypothetical protein
MEFNSQQGSNCYVIASFMDIFMIAKLNNNKKWIQILGNYWGTIKDVHLEEVNNDAWTELGELIETNLQENWKNDLLESQLMERYIYSVSWYRINLKQDDKFKKYAEHFTQKRDIEESERDEYYDSDDREELERKLREDEFDEYADL